MSSFSGDMQKEQMAVYVQELLSLNQDRQRMMLNNLSKYQSAEAKMAPWPGQAQAGAGQTLGLTQGVSQAAGSYVKVPKAFAPTPTQQRGQADLSSQTPVKVELPSGLGQSFKPAQDEGAVRLHQATQMLQAALANWEACVQGSPAAALRSADPMAQAQAQAQAMAASGRLPQEAMRVQGPPGLSQAQAAPRAQDPDRARKINEYAAMLEKALQNLNTTLPRESAEKAQALLQGITMEKPEAFARPEGQEQLQWLAQLLQSQNKASIDRMNKLVQDSRQQQAATMLAAAAGIPLPHAANLDMVGSPVTPGSLHWAANLAAAQQQMQASPFAVPTGRGAPGGKGWSGAAQGAVETTSRAEMRKGGGPKKRNVQSAGDSTSGASPEASHSGETLRMHLRSLLNVESSRVLIVRKINRLGFSSPTVLKEHFSWYGTVENVLVAHSRVKSGGGQAGMVSRLRPSGLGFVVMSRTEEAELILAQGLEQRVCGTVIRVQKFERRMSEAVEAQEDDEEQDAKEEEEEQFSQESRVMGA